MCALKNTVVSIHSPGTIGSKQNVSDRATQFSLGQSAIAELVAVRPLPLLLCLCLLCRLLCLFHVLAYKEKSYTTVVMKPKLNYIGDITSPTWHRNILRHLFPWKYTSLLVTLIAHRQQKPLKVQFLICGHDFSLKGFKR